LSTIKKRAQLKTKAERQRAEREHAVKIRDAFDESPLRTKNVYRQKLMLGLWTKSPSKNSIKNIIWQLWTALLDLMAHKINVF
jgi:hypothetical protein